MKEFANQKDKRKLAAVFTVVILATVLSGCSFGKGNVEAATQALSEVPTPAPAETAEFPLKGKIRGITYSISPDATYYKTSEEPGYFYDTLNEPNAPDFYFITCGKRPTSGYGVRVVNIDVDKDKCITITVEFTEPAEGEDVTEEETYPCVLVVVDDGAKETTIRTTGGMQLHMLNVY